MPTAPGAFEDYHTHHRRCGHAVGELRDMIEAAHKKGLRAVGLSDHAPMLHLSGDWPLPNTAMPRSMFAEYVEEMHNLQREFAAAIPVKAGVEADYVSGFVEAYRELLAPHDFDYVIGSVHFVDGWSIFSATLPPQATREDVWERYLTLTGEAAACGLFDILGHLDCLKTKGHLPRQWRTPTLLRTLDAIADCKVAIELNTSGWRKPVGDCFPTFEILQLAAARGIPVCLGSDAHRPKDVAADFGRAVELLRKAGYRSLASFSGREREEIPLNA